MDAAPAPCTAGRGHLLRQAVIALVAGTASWEALRGGLLVVPQAPHRLEAPEDSAVLLTVTKRA